MPQWARRNRLFARGRCRATGAREDNLADAVATGQDTARSIPALLARNAARYGALPAYREKEFGIWQSWTWAQSAQT